MSLASSPPSWPTPPAPREASRSNWTTTAFRWPSPQKVRSPDGSWCSHWRLHPAHWSATLPTAHTTRAGPAQAAVGHSVPQDGGRIYHEGLELRFSDLTIRTSGSVGVDQSLALLAEMPVPPKWVASMPVAASLGNLAWAFRSREHSGSRGWTATSWRRQAGNCGPGRPRPPEGGGRQQPWINYSHLRGESYNSV